MDVSAHTPMLGLWYPKGLEFDLVGFSVADYGGDNVDHKSTSCTCHFLGRSLVCWSSKKQNCVSLHCWIWIHCCWILLCLAYVDEANSQGLWHPPEACATLLRQWKRHQDCQQPGSALEDKAHWDSHHFLRDHVMKEDIDIIHVNTEEQLVDIFTKPLDEKRFCKLRCELNTLESSNVLWSGTHPNTYAYWWLRCATQEVKYIFNQWRLTF